MSRIEKIIEMLNTSPKDSFLNHALAMEYIKIGNTESATNLLKEVLEVDPNYVGSYYHLAKLYEAANETSMAISTYENGLVAAQKAGDRHAFNELRSALDELVM
jgi:Tfp pilus assembly protein PilF